jgi:hypothetical protein
MNITTETEMEIETEYTPEYTPEQPVITNLSQLINNYWESKPVNNYLASKQGEISQCSKTYSDMLNNSNGAAFINVFVDPLYNQIRDKACDPNNFKAYLSRVINMPDTVNNISNKLDVNDARMTTIENKINTIENKINSTIIEHQYGYSWFDGKTIMLLTIIIICFLCLAISIFFKPTVPSDLIVPT